MQQHQIYNIIHSYFNPNLIETLTISINEHNQQIEKIQLILPDDVISTIPNFFTSIGTILDKLTQLTIDDNYGDITECSMNYSSFFTYPGNDEDLFTSITYTINIDS